MNEEKIFYKKENNDLKWSCYEFLYHKKDSQWFLIFWIIAGSIFLSLLLFRNIFGAATMAFFTIIMYIYAIKEPEIIDCEMNEKGIVFNDRIFSYNSIESFWIIYEPPVKKLLIISKHTIMPMISIPIEEADPVEIREKLMKNGIKEKEEDEPLADIIARKLRF